MFVWEVGDSCLPAAQDEGGLNTTILSHADTHMCMHTSTTCTHAHTKGVINYLVPA